MLLYMLAQRAQRAENLSVVFVIGAQLDAVGFRNGKCEFQNVD
jgi:hypothetical protein